MDGLRNSPRAMHFDSVAVRDDDHERQQQFWDEVASLPPPARQARPGYGHAAFRYRPEKLQGARTEDVPCRLMVMAAQKLMRPVDR